MQTSEQVEERFRRLLSNDVRFRAAMSFVNSIPDLTMRDMAMKHVICELCDQLSELQKAMAVGKLRFARDVCDKPTKPGVWLRRTSGGIGEAFRIYMVWGHGIPPHDDMWVEMIRLDGEDGPNPPEQVSDMPSGYWQGPIEWEERVGDELSVSCYHLLAEAVSKCPETWLPNLLCELTDLCTRKKVFQPGAMLHAVERWEKEAQQCET